MVEYHNNSTIFRDVDEDDFVIDITHIGSDTPEDKAIKLTELDNGFSVGDAIYFDYKNKHYRRALANNTIMSEVIGIVNKIIDKDNFELTLKGNIITDRYKSIETGKPLYLSSIITGRLTEVEPEYVSKIIGIKTSNGLKVDIQRGYNLIEHQDEEFTNTREYTPEEIQEIIDTVKKDIY